MFRRTRYHPDLLAQRAAQIRKWQGDTFDVQYASASLDLAALAEFHRVAAPIALCDGVWLHGVLQRDLSDRAVAALANIYYDELGSGTAVQNHARIYLDLMRQLNILDHHPTTLEFANDPRIPAKSFRFACILMALRSHTDRFFPEILGFTLSVELEGLGCLYRFMTRELERNGKSALFYRVHVAADNLGSGHSHIAIEAINRYIQAFSDLSAGSRVVNCVWRRIWNGLLAFRTLQFTPADGL
jgi:hypothetical protein